MTVDEAAGVLGDLRQCTTTAIAEIAQLCLWALSLNPSDYDAQLTLRLIGRTLRDREEV